MARAKHNRRFRIKLLAYALLSLVAGIGLLALKHAIQSPEDTASITTTAPAEAPSAPSPKQAAAQNLGGLLLLFSVAGFLLTVLFVGWIVIDIRNARPAWKKQTKYPKKR